MGASASSPFMGDRKLSKEELKDFETAVERASENCRRILEQSDRVVLGQKQVNKLTFMAILAGGHIFQEGLPGLGKTLGLKNLAPALGLDFKRIQCTPDLMPADIVGSVVLENGDFTYKKGPIHAQLVMADEINRAGPRVQSAFLQAMEEKQVTVNGVTYDLPKPFHVVATQNPLDQEGTFPLPEAQLDRFLLKVKLGYPALEPSNSNSKEMIDPEIEIMLRKQDEEAHQIIDAQELQSMQALIKTFPLSSEFAMAASKLIKATRPNSEYAPKIVNEFVSFGVGPRGVKGFAQVCRANALLRGDFMPNNDDIRATAHSLMGHRMGMNYTAFSSGYDEDKVIDELLDMYVK